MSAPNTNTEKQARRHRGPLVGIALSIGFVVLLYVAYTVWIAADADAPEGADTLIDGRTGAVSEGEGNDTVTPTEALPPEQ